NFASRFLTSDIWLLTSVLCCLAGMGTKETMAGAPLLVLLYDRTFVSGSFGEAWQRRRKFYLSLAATWLPLAWLVASSDGRGQSVMFNSVVPWWQYALIQAAAIIRYLRLSLWPSGQIFDYGLYIISNPFVVVSCFLFISLLVAGTVISLKRWPAVGFLGAWFFLILAPSSSVVPVVTQTVAEHRMYLPLAAVVSLGVIGLHRAARGYSWIVLLPMAAALGVATFARNHVYKSALSLWSDTVRKNPGNHRAQNNLGIAYIQAGDVSKAIPCFTASLRLLQGYGVQTNLGNALLKAGHTDEAIAELRKAVQLDPDSAQIRTILAHALVQAGRSDEAIAQLERAVTLDPQDNIAQHNLATALVRAGRLDEAASRFEIVLTNNPKDIDARNSYGLLLGRMGQLPEAINQFEAALRLNPDSAETHDNLGLALAMSGQDEQAINHFTEAVRLDPKLPDARYNFAKVLMKNEKWPEAIEQYRALLSLIQPTAEICNSLGAAYANLGQMTEASRWFREALKLDPQNASARENLSRIEDEPGGQHSP
ncbi:MAG: tetratricopeptide repeat protein, partial [Verrucomicrobiota bacterium]|nr:tetratricopeptide repeat protein [Verrucomicrobiota bacterium]